MSKIKVLFFTADPLSVDGRAPRLQLDKDAREIRDRVRAAEHRDALDFDFWQAARARDLLQALNQVRPQVVHFSGHGDRDGLVLASTDGPGARTADTAVLKRVFKVFRGDIRVVVLNACMSLPKAEAIAEVVGCAIGMRGKISDEAAIAFGASFYSAIAFGKSVQAAYDQGCLALAVDHRKDHECPVLLTRPDVNPAELVLVSPPAARSALAARARRWAGMAVVATSLVSGVFLLDELPPEPGSSIEQVKAGDLMDAKALYEAENYAAAFPRFQRIAQDGDAEAMGFLGIMYLHGQGTSPNRSLAELWLREAVDKKRDARAMHGLGIWYELDHRYYLAKHWYEAAVKERGFVPAMSSLAALYAQGRDVRANRQEALFWYQKAAAAGFVDALVGAGEIYERGLDGPRDTDAALRLYSQAAEKGSARAMEAIGRMYQEGDGVPRDPEKARYWYEKAREAGSDVAAANLALLRAD
jgi:TPR repeat protein